MQYAISFLEGVTAFLSPGLLPLLMVFAVWCFGGGLRSNKQSLTAGFGFCLGFGAVFLAAGALHLRGPGSVCGLVLLLLGLLRICAWEEKIPELLLHPSLGLSLALYWAQRYGFFPERLTSEGLVLLVCYVLGVMVPFLFGGVFIHRLKTELSWLRNHLRETALISGIVLLSAGFMMMK